MKFLLMGFVMTDAYMNIMFLVYLYAPSPFYIHALYIYFNLYPTYE